MIDSVCSIVNDCHYDAIMPAHRCLPLIAATVTLVGANDAKRQAEQCKCARTLGQSDRPCLPAVEHCANY